MKNEDDDINKIKKRVTHYLKGKINRDIDMTDYPVRPYVPRLIGKVENIKITTNQTQPHTGTAMPTSQSVLSIASLGLQSSRESLNDNGSSPARY